MDRGSEELNRFPNCCWFHRKLRWLPGVSWGRHQSRSSPDLHPWHTSKYARYRLVQDYMVVTKLPQNGRIAHPRTSEQPLRCDNWHCPKQQYKVGHNTPGSVGPGSPETPQHFCRGRSCKRLYSFDNSMHHRWESSNSLLRSPERVGKSRRVASKTAGNRRQGSMKFKFLQ